MRYFLKLSYDGTPFHGWQRQPNADSVQQRIEEALAIVLRRPVPVTGAGRTDTGVNARIMYAHFDVEEPVADSRKFLQSLNRLCGKAIELESLLPVVSEAHARFDATSRTYKYFVAYSHNPFLRHYSYTSPARLDVEAMNDAASLLLDTDDFTSFAKLHADAKTNICDVRLAKWEPWVNEYGVEGIVFTIEADRFLRNMVRAVVGTLVEVGRGKLDKNGFADIIEKKDRCSAGTSMPAEALFLWDISYPEDIFLKNEQVKSNK